MAEASKVEQANKSLPYQGDHDRIAMLSLNADGTADQHNPEVIIDKAAAVEASQTQFAQQAVSAVDVEKRGVTSGLGADSVLVGQEDGTTKEVAASEVPQDGSVDELTKAHDAAAKSALSAAESAVGSLVKS
jgi:hypothetical protein